MTTATKYDRKAIMTRAWEIVKENPSWRLAGAAFWLRRALWRAWGEAKAAARPPMSEADSIRYQISMLENKDHWTQADYRRRDELQAELRRATEHEQAETGYAEKRALIAGAKGRFCTVTFIKADGTLRTMQVQPATLQRHVKGDAATEAGKRATATRKARHPNLLPVWDAQAKAPRSVNLATVSRIAVDGREHLFA